jgi:hypothetical protein
MFLFMVAMIKTILLLLDNFLGYSQKYIKSLIINIQLLVIQNKRKGQQE